MPKLSFSSSSAGSSHHLIESLPPWLLSTLRAAKMKGKASGFLKHVVSLLVSVVKAKSVAVKSKTSAIKTRLIVFGLLRNKKALMSTISHKIHALMGQDKEGSAAAAHDNNKAIVLYGGIANEAPPDVTPTGMLEWGESRAGAIEEDDEEEDDGYPDLRHSLFDDEDDYFGDDGTGSVIDLVKNSRGEDQGEFVLEDEIDHVADVFIRRFHKQMKMQKLESFKRFQEMMERSV